MSALGPLLSKACAPRSSDLRAGFTSCKTCMGNREHKWWKFEHCPAPACEEARRALDITEPREPGAEG